ncbi:MAG TPA: hypothetical protein VF772_27840 [Terriglobales bacterium]
MASWVANTVLLLSVSQPANLSYHSSRMRDGEPQQPLACANEPVMISSELLFRYAVLGNGIAL